MISHVKWTYLSKRPLPVDFAGSSIRFIRDMAPKTKCSNQRHGKKWCGWIGHAACQSHSTSIESRHGSIQWCKQKRNLAIHATVLNLRLSVEDVWVNHHLHLKENPSFAGIEIIFSLRHSYDCFTPYWWGATTVSCHFYFEIVRRRRGKKLSQHSKEVLAAFHASDFGCPAGVPWISFSKATNICGLYPWFPVLNMIYFIGGCSIFVMFIIIIMHVLINQVNPIINHPNNYQKHSQMVGLLLGFTTTIDHMIRGPRWFLRGPDVDSLEANFYVFSITFLGRQQQIPTRITQADHSKNGRMSWEK